MLILGVKNIKLNLHPCNNCNYSNNLNKMKRRIVFSSLVLSSLFLVYSCGPSAEEKAKREQEVKDSIAAVEQARQDSIAAVEQARQDSIAAVEKAKADSALAAESAKGQKAGTAPKPKKKAEPQKTEEQKASETMKSARESSGSSGNVQQDKKNSDQMRKARGN